jgi:hypothetical protein
MLIVFSSYTLRSTAAIVTVGRARRGMRARKGISQTLFFIGRARALETRRERKSKDPKRRVQL